MNLEVKWKPSKQNPVCPANEAKGKFASSLALCGRDKATGRKVQKQYFWCSVAIKSWFSLKMQSVISPTCLLGILHMLQIHIWKVTWAQNSSLVFVSASFP